MRCRDPRADAEADGYADDYVEVQGDLVAVDDAGEFTHPAITEAWARDYADRQGVDYERVVVDDTCEVVKSDGEVCGRDLPCPYHDD
jgi:hypothetical protein